MMQAKSREETYISLSQIGKNTGINRGLLHYYSKKGQGNAQPRIMVSNGIRLIEINCAVQLLKDRWLHKHCTKTLKNIIDPVRVSTEIDRLKGMSGYDPQLHH
jgi:hypothetical protein